MDELKNITGCDIFFLDFETNGLRGEVIEIGLYHPEDKKKCMSKIIYTDRRIDKSAQRVHKIPTEKIRKGIDKGIAFAKLKALLGENAVIVAHNSRYERDILIKELGERTVDKWTFVCTLKYARFIHTQYNVYNNIKKTKTGKISFKLEALCEFHAIKTTSHRAYHDSKACCEILKILLGNVKNLNEAHYRCYMVTDNNKKTNNKLDFFGIKYEKKTSKSSKPKNKTTIKSILDAAKDKLKEDFSGITIDCEVASINTKIYGSVHFNYITLKDDSCVIDAIYRGRAEDVHQGDKLSVTGDINIFTNKNTSRIQFVVLRYSKIGLGEHLIELNKLKKKLKSMGVFDDKIKKEIGTNYRKIGLITSIDAAGFKDMLAVFTARVAGTELVVYNSVMQGAKAPKSIVNSIKLANEHNYVDLLILARGGGSREDLGCFDDERIAFAIFNSDLPIVTGIGHDIDTSIADLASDRRFITPTAAAEGVTYDKNVLLTELKGTNRGLKKAFENLFRTNQNGIREYNTRLNNAMVGVFTPFRNALFGFHSGLKTTMMSMMAQKHEEISRLSKALAERSPGIEIKDKILMLMELESRCEGIIHNLIEKGRRNIEDLNDDLRRHEDTLKSCTIVCDGVPISSREQLINLAPKKFEIFFPDGVVIVSTRKYT